MAAFGGREAQMEARELRGKGAGQERQEKERKPRSWNTRSPCDADLPLRTGTSPPSPPRGPTSQHCHAEG